MKCWITHLLSRWCYYMSESISHGYFLNDFPGGKLPLSNYRLASWDLGGIICNGSCLLCQNSFWLLYDVALYYVLFFQVLLYFVLCKVTKGCKWMVPFVCSCVYLYMIVHLTGLPQNNLTVGVVLPSKMISWSTGECLCPFASSSIH